MRKEYYLYITIIILFILGVIYYNRPLNLQWLTDPGEAYFTLPERTLPSSWNMVKQDYGHDSPSTIEKEKLNIVDKILQDRDIRWDLLNIYSKTSQTGVLEEIYRDKNSELFNSGDNREVIEHHINNFARYISGYELYPPQYNFATAIPSFIWHQSIFRVGSRYTALLCHEWQLEQCVTYFQILFKFAQQTKKSGTLVSLLIWVVEEDIMMSHITYLYNSDPERYQSIITMLQSEKYLSSEESIRNAFITEYNMLKNEMYNMPLHLLQAYDMVSIVQSDDQRDPTSLVLGIFKVLRIPPKWLFDIPETLHLARWLYYKGSTIWLQSEEYNNMTITQEYRPSRHPLTRKNIIGYHFLNAVIPRLTGIQGRAIDQETRFNNLINPN